jgi:hypothetical protein
MARRRFRNIATSLLLSATALLVWSSLPASVPARGRFHDFDLNTTVDSEAARYYVESYAQGLSGDISRLGWDKYLLMRSDGPNDGLFLLPDLLFPEGRTIVSPKGDHFFAEDPLIGEKTVALVQAILDGIDD